MFLFRDGGDRVTVDEAHRRSGAPAVLLDVREQRGWTAGHTPGAVHAPLSRLTAGAALPGRARPRYLPGPAQGRPPVLIRRSGRHSRRAAGLPAGRGARAVDAKGGIRARAAAGQQVVDGRGNHGSIA
ncbi:rhodanese-like domain-containing protein [Streptomyces sp. NPDC015220]|uniref:rhodanese-like domain-containing protein n=1 Tax=Streptomyces sp. NPDC015220 TaxID=3364947 RepID=UPI0036F7792E